MARYLSVLLIMFASCFIPPTVSEAGRGDILDVITSKQLENPEMTIKEVIDIFTGRKTRWDDKTEIVVLTYEENSVRAHTFLLEVLGITPYQYKSRLQRNLYRGRGKKPVELKSEEEMFDYIIDNDQSIGYLYNYMLYKDEERIVIINVVPG